VDYDYDGRLERRLVGWWTLADSRGRLDWPGMVD
jgi:hypothetical protein